MSRYLEKDAIYQVAIPDDWEFDEEDLKFPCQRQYWADKLIQLLLGNSFGGNYTKVLILNKNLKPYYTDRKTIQYTFHKTWIGELVRHCPQVEHYIQNQEKQKYVSPFDGKPK